MTRQLASRLLRMEQQQARRSPKPRDLKAESEWLRQGMIDTCGSVEAYMDALYRVAAEQGRESLETMLRQLKYSEEDVLAIMEAYIPAGGAGKDAPVVRRILLELERQAAESAQG